MSFLASPEQNDPQAIGIATIHAAIVAVFVGAVVAYAVLVLYRIHEMRDDVIETAREINTFKDAVMFIDNTDRDFLRKFDVDKLEDRYELISRIPGFAERWIAQLRRSTGP